MARTAWLVAMLVLVNLPGPLAAAPGPQADDQSFYLQMRDGGIIEASSGEQEIVWKSVAIDGQVSESVIRLSEIKSLQLAQTPASVQVAEIRRLVNELADDDYHKRHEAEQQLVVEGLPFITIIEQFRDHTEPEARYRVARVLHQLKNDTDSSRAPVVIEFDRLETVDGRVLDGDIGDWTFQGTWRDKPVEANRTNCVGLDLESPVTLQTERPHADEPVRVAHVISPNHFTEGTQPRDGIKMATFETANNGITLETGLKDPVETMFSFLGCLLSCETENGNVIISGYKFKKGLSRKNSVSNLYRDAETGKMTRYSGIMRIDFCLPGQPGIPAHVGSAGLGTEIVVPKHTLVQAWNSAGHVVGLTWSTADRNSFIGFDSNTDIAWLTISANDFLNVEKLNRDFAVDDLCFSQPAFAAEISRETGDSAKIVIITANGNRVLANSVTFDAGNQAAVADVSTARAGQVPIPVSEIRSITGPPATPPSPGTVDGLSVMTRDGSVVHVNPEGLAALDNPQQILAEDDVIGFWNPDQPARYPHPDDFETGSLVIVRPLDRIAITGSIDWSAGTASLETDEGKTIQQSTEVGVNQFQISDDLPEEIQELGIGPRPLTEFSNVWLDSPKNRAHGTGLLRTRDGQQFVLNGTSGFELRQLDGDQVTVGRGDQTFAWSMDEITVLELPE